MTVAENDPRREEIVVGENGLVRGALIWWIPGRLPPWELGRGWERWIRLQPPIYFSPFQRPPQWRAIRNGRLRPEETELWTLEEAPEQPPSQEEAAQLSDLVLFDFLISNVDRWSEDYTNVRRTNGELIYLDNGAGLWPGRNRLGLMDARLAGLQRFRRSTLDRLREFRLERFRERIATDPLAPVLTEFQIQGIEERRLAVLEHAAAMHADHGDAIYFDLP